MDPMHLRKMNTAPLQSGTQEDGRHRPTRAPGLSAEAGAGRHLVVAGQRVGRRRVGGVAKGRQRRIGQPGGRERAQPGQQVSVAVRRVRAHSTQNLRVGQASGLG